MRGTDPTGSGAAYAAEQLERRWYVAYTCANQEKRVQEQLQERAVEHFLPLYSCLRRWSDRRVRLEMPLFPGYIFVRMALRDRLRVLQLPRLVRLVGFGTLPTPLPEGEVDALRAGLASHPGAEPHRFLNTGHRIRISRGPFQGLEGILLRKRGNLRVVISVQLIQRSIMVDLNAADLEPCGGTSNCKQACQ